MCYEIKLFLPGQNVVKFKHRPTSKLASRTSEIPNTSIIIDFYCAYATKASACFGPVPCYWRVNQVIVPGNIPATTIRIDTIAGIPIGITKGIVLDEQELFASKIR